MPVPNWAKRNEEDVIYFMQFGKNTKNEDDDVVDVWIK